MSKCSSFLQANSKLADRKDDDERLPIHWATSYGHLEIAKMLAAQKNFDPDVQVRLLCFGITYCELHDVVSKKLTGFRMVRDGRR